MFKSVYIYFQLYNSFPPVSIYSAYCLFIYVQLSCCPLRVLNWSINWIELKLNWIFPFSSILNVTYNLYHISTTIHVFYLIEHVEWSSLECKLKGIIQFIINSTICNILRSQDKLSPYLHVFSFNIATVITCYQYFNVFEEF